MFDVLRSALAYIFALGVLVFFHELGHYLAARSRGVVVEAFSIGFGPALLAWRAKSGTVWRISALPLGGYVKMQGWGGDAEADPVPGSFSSMSLKSKAFIVAAGPLANLVLAFVVFSGLFMTAGQEVVEPVFSAILPGSPAAQAGLQTGDRVLSVSGQTITDFSQLQAIIISHPDAKLLFSLARQGAVVSRLVVMGDAVVDGKTIGHLGIAADSSLRRESPPRAVIAAAQETYNDSAGIVQGIYNLVVHRQRFNDLAGPLGIAQITGKVAALGLASFVNLLALLSINLGLVNLIPIPILDGGHLLFYAAEALYGRPIPARAQDIALRFGGALIVSLLFVTTFNDLSRWGAVHWVAHLFG